MLTSTGTTDQYESELVITSNWTDRSRTIGIRSLKALNQNAAVKSNYFYYQSKKLTFIRMSLQPASAELGAAREPNYRQQPAALLTYLWRYPNGS